MHKNLVFSGMRCLLLGILFCYPATDLAAESKVQPATYQESPASAAVKFRQQPARVGDRVSQQVAIHLDMKTKVVQSGQIAHQDHTTLQRRQRRLIEVTEVAEGRVRRARVSFSYARSQSPESQEPDQLKAQVVEGKSYLVERRGKSLLVTDMQGAIPTQKEFEIVLSSVQTLGLPNPLAEFLVQRAIHVGDRFAVPKELAERIMGFDDQLGQVQKFELALQSLQTIEGETCALFETTIVIRGDQSNPLQVNIEGQVLIQTATCRTVEAKLTGPLHMTAIEESYEFSAEGGLEMAIRSQYDTSKNR